LANNSNSATATPSFLFCFFLEQQKLQALIFNLPNPVLNDLKLELIEERKAHLLPLLRKLPRSMVLKLVYGR
jgi:hypothetical protein